MDMSLSVPYRRAGLALIGTGGLLSTLSASSLLSYILYCAFIARKRTPFNVGVHQFARSPMGNYLISLFAFDLIQGLAFSVNLRWAHKAEIEISRLCVMQGAVSQIGDLGIATWSFVIAVHTFFLLFLQRKPGRWAHFATMAIGMGFILFMPLIGTAAIGTGRKGSFWGPSGAWCWVADDYKDLRIPFFYVWAFVFLFASMIIYPLIYLKFAGVIDYFGGQFSFGTQLSVRSLPWCTGRRPSIATSSNSGGGDGFDDGDPYSVNRDIVKIARRLTWYPVIYFFVVVPVAVARIGNLLGWEAPFWFYSIAGFFFASSGVTDAALFLFTRQTFIQTAMRRERTVVSITTQRFTEEDDVPKAPGLPPPSPLAKSFHSRDLELDEYGRPPPSPQSDISQAFSFEKKIDVRRYSEQPFGPPGLRPRPGDGLPRMTFATPVSPTDDSSSDVVRGEAV